MGYYLQALIDMKEEFEKLVAAGKITRSHVEPLVRLAQCGYCVHKSWGFGKITSVDTVFSRFQIDFPAKPGHSMDLAFAAESLKPIPKDHILARKATDLAGLQKQVAVNHLELIKLVLNSYGGKATLEQIQQSLVPDVITADWKKWWEEARHELKKDGHFKIPTKKNELITYQDVEISLQDRLLGEFREAKGLKARLNLAPELIRSLGDLQDPKATIEEAVRQLNLEIKSHQRTQPFLALEAIFVREELREKVGLPPTEGEIVPRDIWVQNPPLAQIDQMSSGKHKAALESFQAANPEAWGDTLLEGLNSIPTRVCGEAVNLLIHSGKQEPLKACLARLITQHQAGSDLLLWLAQWLAREMKKTTKERNEAFADILGPDVFRAMLSAIERDQFNEKRSNKLRDFILDEHDLLGELIRTADIDVVKDLTRTLKLSPSFDDMDKRSLLARIVKIFPAIQPLISGDPHSKQETTLIVSWDSLERRKHEYNDLVHRKIPANSKEIAIARSYGDLRENAEFKAAKEMQKILMRRKGELEVQLGQARGMSFENVGTDTVNIGTRITVTDQETGHVDTYSIMGAWDTDVDKGIISYLSPVGQAVLNHKAGDILEVELEGHRKKIRIDAIAPVELASAVPAPAATAPVATETTSTQDSQAPATA